MRFLGLCLLFLSFSTLANTQLTTQVTDIDFGKDAKDHVLVFLSSGHVGKISKTDKALAGRAGQAIKSNDVVNISLDENRFILGFEKAAIISRMNDVSTPAKLFETFTPTTIESMKVAKSYFRSQRLPQKEETQCFNRAMVWTYELWKAHSLKSNKLLIFFSRNYIRRYDFEWWFHIAPYVHIQDNGVVLERVMDRKYTGGPLEFRKWSNLFMRNDAECPVITKYSDYSENPYTGECFLFRTHMYTYQPADLQMYEAWGYSKSAFNMNEVKGAYLEAFSAPEHEEEEEETEGGGETGGATNGTL